MKLYVDYTVHTDESYFSGEQWGDWYEHYSSYINGVSLTETYGSEAFEVSFEAEAGERVYVLSMIYSSGDSFGLSTGNLEIIWVFKDYEIAKLAKETIEDNSGTLKFLDDNGNEIGFSNPALGYFNSLESVEIDSFIIGK